jgi:uncharacterized protein YjiS (DUF1127 family)
MHPTILTKDHFQMSRFYDDRASVSNGWLGLTAALDVVDRKFVRRALAWRRNRATYRELAALDDHQLADIGLSRSDLDTASFVASRAPSHRG